MYTYFGQFIDHDLTFDPASSLQKQNDPDALEDFRTPRFDLDNVYGRGPDDQPYLYADGRTFLLGKAFVRGRREPPGPGPAAQLGRGPGSARTFPPATASSAAPIIGDPRNDENVIVSQLQGLLHRFHNKLAADHPHWAFEEVQRQVRFHYQWVVLNDFLPKIVHASVLNLIAPHVLKGTDVVADPVTLQFFKWENHAYMPLEFSAAAYRFGHSMVRPGYRLSETVPPIELFVMDPDKALTGFREFPDNWAIDWNLFRGVGTPRPGRHDPDAARLQDRHLPGQPAGQVAPVHRHRPEHSGLAQPGARLADAPAFRAGRGARHGRGAADGQGHQDWQVHRRPGGPARLDHPRLGGFCGQLPPLDLRPGGNLGDRDDRADLHRGPGRQNPVSLAGRRTHRGGDVCRPPVGRQAAATLAQHPLWKPAPKYALPGGKFGLPELLRTALSL